MPTLEPLKAKAELCRREGGFFRFVQYFWHVVIPEQPVYNWHIPYLCSRLEEYGWRIARRQAKLSDLIINISPGESKSTICTVMFPVWLWCIDETTRAMTASYSDSLSTDHALKSRDIIRSAMFQGMFPHIKIKADQDNKTHYKNTATGERYATSVGGTVTGFHAHVIIVDDPINPKKAASAVSLAEATDFMDRTLSTRKVDKQLTPIILVMQRLHENDPTGHILRKAGKEVEYICLPATLNDKVHPPELSQYYQDGLFDPVRLSQSALDDLKTDLGSYGYAGQMMQQPSPEGGGIWQRWIMPVPDHEMPEIRTMSGYGTDWDTAYTDKAQNASSAFVVSGKVGEKMYIDNLGWFNKEFPELIKEMRSLPDPHYVEAKASGKSAKQTLVAAGIPAMEVEVNGDKLARARDATPKAEAGMVYCRASLLDRLYNDNEQGILKFPNSPKMDVADTLAQAIMRHFPNRLIQAVTGSLGQAMGVRVR